MLEPLHEENRRRQSEGKSPLSEAEAKDWLANRPVDPAATATFPDDEPALVDEPSENPDLIDADHDNGTPNDPDTHTENTEGQEANTNE